MAEPKEGYNSGVNRNVTGTVNSSGEFIPSGGAGSVTTLETYTQTDGAAQTGTSVAMPGSKVAFQSVANGPFIAYTATVTILGSNDDTNFITLGTMNLSGTGPTADVAGLTIDAPWAFVRADVSNFTGAGATCAVYMAV